MVSETSNRISCDKCSSVHRPGKCPKENPDNKNNSGGCPIDHDTPNSGDSCPVDPEDFMKDNHDFDAGLEWGDDYDRDSFLEQVKNSDEYSIFFEDLPDDTQEKKERLRDLVGKLREAEKQIDSPDGSMDRGKFNILVDRLQDLDGANKDSFSEDIARKIAEQQTQEFNTQLRESFGPIVEEISKVVLETDGDELMELDPTPYISSFEYDPIRRNKSFDELETDDVSLEEKKRLADIIDNHKRNVSGKFRFETNRFDKFLFTSLDFVNTSYSSMVAPYNKNPEKEKDLYSKDFAKKMLRATSIVLQISDKLLAQENLDNIQQNKLAKFFRDGAARRQPRLTIQEGINSMMESIILLMTQDIGQENDNNSDLEKFRKIVEQDLIIDFIRKIPAGVIGPITLDGKYPEDILSDDGLSIENESFKEKKREIQESYKSPDSVITNLNPHYFFEEGTSLSDAMCDRVFSKSVPGAVCPVGQQSERTDTNPLRSLGESFLHIMEELEENY